MAYCYGCKKSCGNAPKFSIFERDSMTQKCLVFKIFQITGADDMFKSDMDGIFLCLECHTMLIQIQILEQKFADQFNAEMPTKNELKRSLKITASRDIYKVKEENQLDFEKNIIKILDKGNSTAPKSYEDSHDESSIDIYDESNDYRIMKLVDEDDNYDYEPIEVSNFLKNESIYTYHEENEEVSNEEKNDTGKNKSEKKKRKSNADLIKEIEGFSCPFGCKRKFTQELYLERHVKGHSTNKPHNCSFCPKKFKTKWLVGKHERIHTGEKPFECKECDKAFNQKSSLVSHLKKYHLITFEAGSTYKKEDYFPQKLY